MIHGTRLIAAVLSGLALASLAFAPAGSQEKPECAGVYTPPQWVSRPSGEQLIAVYPKGAMRTGKGGIVRVTCQVKDDGAMGDCRVVREEPKGFGFGEAALILAQYFKIKPGTCDGQVIKGAEASFPINFAMR